MNPGYECNVTIPAPVSPDVFSCGSRLLKGTSIVMHICDMHIPSGNTI